MSRRSVTAWMSPGNPRPAWSRRRANQSADLGTNGTERDGTGRDGERGVGACAQRVREVMAAAQATSSFFFALPAEIVVEDGRMAMGWWRVYMCGGGLGD
jgi:hypothetical protein